MLSNTESFTEVIERIQEELRIAGQRHQALREEFDEFRRRELLNSTALQNRLFCRHTTD